jgi:REP element-mobilizing transposase RayT
VRWFTEPLCERIAEYICEAGAASTTRVLAFTVMPNHLHIIARQGADPLGWMMQRVLQRTALLVRRTYDHQDHVFGRRYWSGLVDDARYLRQVIIYTHLNPYYAGLCSDPAEYKWTSHGAYAGLAGTAPWSMHVWADHGLRVFASAASVVGDLRTDYMRFIRYWMRRPKLPLGAKYLFTTEELETAPLAQHGDAFWQSEYGDVVPSVTCVASASVDVRDRAGTALRALAPDLTLDQVRLGGRIKAINSVRRQLIAMLLSSGCRNGAIARCLNVSTSHVSTVAADIRNAMLHGIRGPDNDGNGRS